MPLLTIRPKLRRRWKAIAIGLVLLVAAAVVGIACFLKFGDYPGAWYSTYAAADGDWALTRKARTGTPMINALHRYHDQNGHFPQRVCYIEF
jgi:hypothetical protein